MRSAFLAGALVCVFAGLAIAQDDVPPAARAEYDRAEIAREESRFKEAVEFYRKAIDAHPTYVAAHAGHLAALRGQGDLYPAAELYARLVSAHPDSVDLKAFQAAALPEPEHSVEALSELSKAHPDNVRVFVELGRALLEIDDSKHAESALKTALKLDEESLSARMLMGDVFAARGKFTRARKEYATALEIDSAYVPAHLRIALAWHRGGKTDQALKELNNLLGPDNLPRLVAGHWLIASILAETGDYEGAIGALDKVLAIKKDDPRTLMAKGSLLLKQDKPILAVAIYAKVAELMPRSPEPVFCLGWAHEKSADSPEVKGKEEERTKRLKLAADAYERCAEMDPGVRPRDSLGFVSLLAGMHVEAVTQFRRATDIDPKFAAARNNLGLADDLADNRANAKKRYEEVLKKIDKKNVRAHVMLALDLWIDGSANKAIKELEKALKLDPDDDLAWTFVGDIHYDNRKTDQAIKAYKKATEINDRNFIAWYHMGIAYDDSKRKDEEADRCYRKALEAKADPPDEMILRLAILNDDTALNRLDEALKFYQLYRDLGGTEEWVPARIEELKEQLAGDG